MNDRRLYRTMDLYGVIFHSVIVTKLIFSVICYGLLASPIYARFSLDCEKMYYFE